MADHREQLGQTILSLCQGHQAAHALLAQVDALGTTIGALHQMSGAPLEEAEAVAGRVSGMLIEHIRENWGEYRIGGGSD